MRRPCSPALPSERRHPPAVRITAVRFLGDDDRVLRAVSQSVSIHRCQIIRVTKQYRRHRRWGSRNTPAISSLLSIAPGVCRLRRMSQILNEQRIKRLLTRHIKHGEWKRSDALISEYFVENASRRADLVAINGALRAYEIKSDVDHLTRLTGQVEAYSRYFESVTVVCTRRHLAAVLQQTDSSVGVLCASNDGIEEYRTAVTRQLADTDAWLSHLPIRAIHDSLSLRGIQCPRVNRRAVLEVARSHMTTEQARSEVLCYLRTHKLKQRRALKQERISTTNSDPFAEHAAMLRSYLKSRGITSC